VERCARFFSERLQHRVRRFAGQAGELAGSAGARIARTRSGLAQRRVWPGRSTSPRSLAPGRPVPPPRSLRMILKPVRGMASAWMFWIRSRSTVLPLFSSGKQVLAATGPAPSGNLLESGAAAVWFPGARGRGRRCNRCTSRRSAGTAGRIRQLPSPGGKSLEAGVRRSPSRPRPCPGRRAALPPGWRSPGLVRDVHGLDPSRRSRPQSANLLARDHERAVCRSSP